MIAAIGVGMSYGRGAILGGTVGGMGAEKQAMNMCSVQPPVEVREVDGEMSTLNVNMEDLGRSISDLDERLMPVLRQFPIGGETSGKPSEACTSPLGNYLADKSADVQHLTRRVRGILERLAI